VNLAEIEAELDKLEPHDLRSLALKSWSAFVSKEGSTMGGHLCDENDPEVLAALDQATDRSDAEPVQPSEVPLGH
jgi:hypothetical protein